MARDRPENAAAVKRVTSLLSPVAPFGDADDERYSPTNGQQRPATVVRHEQPASADLDVQDRPLRADAGIDDDDVQRGCGKVRQRSGEEEGGVLHVLRRNLM